MKQSKKEKFEMSKIIKKEKKKIGKNKNGLSNREKKVYLETLKKGLVDGVPIVIDCSYCNEMSEKEQRLLAKQIRYCYGISRRLQRESIQFCLCNLNEKDRFYQICCEQNIGFENYKIKIYSENVTEIFEKDNLCYLSPDGDQSLLSMTKRENIPVIGGFVDHTVRKNISKEKCDEMQINSYRLPLNCYLTKNPNIQSNRILTVNQVFEICAKYFNNDGDWMEAFDSVIPLRKGYSLTKGEKIKEENIVIKNEAEENLSFVKC
ncbi:hypothetical protein SNEBB_008416 [Seison nebaliae]|nr:hypothetical protein SNEBB_008416 [Seison nebaliae]